MCACVLCACLVFAEVRRGHWIPVTYIMDYCKLPCGCWDRNMGLLEEQQMLLIAELSVSL